MQYGIINGTARTPTPGADANDRAVPLLAQDRQDRLDPVHLAAQVDVQYPVDHLDRQRVELPVAGHRGRC